MKWFKFVIGAFIAISVVPLVVLSFLNISKSLESSEIVFTKEVDSPMNSGVVYIYPFTTPTSENDIYDYMVDNDLEGYNITLNLLFDTDVVNVTITERYYVAGDSILFIDNNSLEYQFSSVSVRISNTYDSVYSVNADNLTSIKVIFSKPSNIKHNKIISTIITLAPIIFVGGVVLFIYKPFKKE